MSRFEFCVALSIGFLLAGCAQVQRLPVSETNSVQPESEPTMAQLLPPFPLDREASFATSLQANGADYYHCSANAIVDDTKLELHSASNSISFGVWMFSPYEKSVVSLETVLSVEPGNEVYIAVSDYLRNAWSIAGPCETGLVLPLDNAKCRSEAGNCYIAIITYGGDSATVLKLVLTAQHSWQHMTVDSNGNVGVFNSLAVVDGRPAISYCEYLNSGIGKGLKYVRATDASGQAWGTPQVLNSAYDEYAYTSLEIVNGKPAISFYTYLNVVPLGGGALLYIRAADSAGTAWNATKVVDATGYLMQDRVGMFNSLAIVDGMPAISYCGDALNELVYVRAEDANGDIWGDRQWADLSTEGVGFSTLLVDDGLPLICYYENANTSLKGVGTNPEQTAWNEPFNIDASAGDTGAYASAALVSGAVAVAYYSDRMIFGGELKYVRYDGMSGEWQAQVVSGYGTPGMYASLAVIGGKPAISYYEADEGDLWYVASLDAKGNAWGAPEMVDTLGNVGTYTSLAEVEGKAAISYYDATNRDLKYAIRMGP